MPEQYIYKYGQNDASTMYFMTDGHATKTCKRKHKKYTFSIKKGDMFGETAIICKDNPYTRRRENVKTMNEYCFVDTLTSEKLFELLEEFPGKLCHYVIFIDFTCLDLEKKLTHSLMKFTHIHYSDLLDLMEH